MTAVARLLLLVALLAASLPAAAACDPPSLGVAQKFVDSPNYRIAWRMRPDPIAVSEPFALEISICANPGAQPVEGITIDAVMPEHRHGMNYRPSVIDGPDGRFVVEGMLFHMPGTWRLIFDVRTGAAVERLTQDMTVE